jgi:hypothetical protein
VSSTADFCEEYQILRRLSSEYFVKILAKLYAKNMAATKEGRKRIASIRCNCELRRIPI